MVHCDRLLATYLWLRMQRNGEELLGKRPWEPHKCYRDEPEAQQFIKRQKMTTAELIRDGWHPPLADPRLFWDPIVNGMNQVYLDALTIDARKAAKPKRILAKRNEPVPVNYNSVSKASVGRAPVAMMYLSAHATAGSQGVFPRTGAKEGKKGSLQGFELWHQGIPREWQDQVKEFGYYNHAAALENMTKKTFASHEPFDYRHFKVRSSCTLHCSLSGWPSLSHNLSKGKRTACAARSLASSRFCFSLSYRCSSPHTSMPSHCFVGCCTTRSIQKSGPFMNMPVQCARPSTPFTDISGNSPMMPASGSSSRSSAYTSATPLSARRLCTGQTAHRLCLYSCTLHPSHAHSALTACPSCRCTYTCNTSSCRRRRTLLLTSLMRLLGTCSACSPANAAHTLSAVQKAKGENPQSTVGSEIAAVFDLVMLPRTLDDMLKAETVTGPTETYDMLCKRFACDIKRPDDWHLVHYPFWVSLDNCQKHPHIRKLWLRPRISERQRAAYEVQLEALYCAQLVAKMQAMLNAGFDARAQFPAEQTSGKDDAELMQLYLQRWKDALDADFAKQHDCTFKQWTWRQWALTRPWLRLVFAEQFMPLAAKCAEYHMSIEHLVGTVKLDVGQQAADPANKDDLSKAATYQRMGLRAVNKRGRGAEGCKHVQGSVRKMPCTAQIVSAPLGQSVTVHHTFSNRPGLGSVHEEVGLGGRPPPAGSGAKWR